MANENYRIMNPRLGTRVEFRNNLVRKTSNRIDAKTARMISYAHKIAKVALADIGIDVIQLRIMGTAEKPALMSKRVRMDEISKDYFKRKVPYFPIYFGGMTIKGGRHRKRLDAETKKQVLERLESAGIGGVYAVPHNFAVTSEGRKVLLEVVHETEGVIKPEATLNGFGNATASKIQKLRAEYFNRERRFEER